MSDSKKTRKFRLTTVQGRYLLLLVSMVVPAFLLILSIFSYMVQSFHEQQQKSAAALFENRVAQLAAMLNAAQSSTVNLLLQDNTVTEMQYLPNEGGRIIARISVFNRVRSMLTQYPMLSSCFVLGAHSGDLLTNEKSALAYSERLGLRQDFLRWPTEFGRRAMPAWNLRTVDDQNYLCYLYRGDDAFSGCAIDAADFLDELAPHQERFALALLTESNERIVVKGMADLFDAAAEKQTFAKRYYTGIAPIGSTGFSVEFLIPAAAYPLPLNSMTFYVTCFCAIILPLLFFISNRSFARPVQIIVSDMDRVGDGALDTRIDVKKLAPLEEFVRIGESYNRSLDRISALNEQMLQKERDQQIVRLRALQMQINPHFLMNSLNLIYAAARAGKTAVVEEMTLHLSGYFRFSTYADRDFVLLSEEQQMTEDYLRIQQIRFQNRFSYSISIPPYLKNALVPPMMLKTFAENSIKYAFATGEGRLSIRADMRSIDGKAYLQVVIEDDGIGYPDDVLSHSWQNGIPIYDTTKHTGIINITERFSLLFGQKGSILLSNGPDGGARTELILPLKTEEKHVSNPFA